MAKALKTILNTKPTDKGGYVPKAGDERKFVDKHVIVKHSDANGNDDDVFNGTKVKPVDRKATRHGYDKNADEKVYEELELDEEGVYEDRYSKGDKVIAHSSLTGPREGVVTQVTHDGQRVKVKHGAGAKSISFSYPPHKLKKQTNEEVELSEVTHEGAVRAASVWRAKGDMKRSQLYTKLASALERGDRTTAAGFEDQIRRLKEETEIEEKLNPSMGAGKYVSDFEKSSAPQFKGKSKEKRAKMGIAAYLSAKRGMKEEVEELDELKKETLGRYVNKAAVDLARSGHTLGMTKHFDRTQNQNKKSIGTEITLKRIDKRLDGIKAATKKMTKEDIDVTLLELFIKLDEDNQSIMLQMIDEGRQEELREFALTITEMEDVDTN